MKEKPRIGQKVKATPEATRAGINLVKDIVYTIMDLKPYSNTSGWKVLIDKGNGKEYDFAWFNSIKLDELDELTQAEYKWNEYFGT